MHRLGTFTDVADECFPQRTILGLSSKNKKRVLTKYYRKAQCGSIVAVT